MGYSNCSDFSPLFKKKKALGVILFKIQICDPELKFNKVAWTKKPLLRISTPKGYTDLGRIGGSDYVNGADPWSDFWGVVGVDGCIIPK